MSDYGLSDGISLGMVAAVLIPVGIVTVLLRALPFSILRVLKGSPFIDFLAVLMPVGVMTVLVVYTLVGHAGSPAHLASALVALVATLLLHWWKRRSDVSIFVGTALYMLLVNVVF
ncbi:AzlD domain-containing protein [Corynebacterium pilbarense]|uniref:AzlD domain-containing protein n=1 Tax=Corynebacterium pilbarense TaxID=1288393 RepID=A0A9Q4II58_9CORY|nr:AzlD domain-containing protein [Corynebacterium pilbarense]MCZ2221377.1 AzlD domain-containing protein [Corynebacterium pilbarense]